MHVVKRRSPSESGPTESGPETIAISSSERQSTYFFDWPFPPNSNWTTTDLLSTDDFLRTTTEQPTNLVTTVLLLGAYEVLLRAHIIRLWASEIIQGCDISMMITTLKVESWEKLWEPRAISVMRAILTFLRMIKVHGAERWLGTMGLVWSLTEGVGI